MDKEIKMKLLEMLMEEMDDMSVEKMRPKSPVGVEVEMEAKEVPMPELEEKMGEAMSSEPEMPEDEEDYGDSRLMQRLKDLKSKKM